MEKSFYEKLQEAFEELKKTEAAKVYDAIENHEFPPIPFTLPVVIKTVKEIVDNHEVTESELKEMLRACPRELSADEFELLTRELKKDK